MKEQPQNDVQQSFGIRQSSIEESQVGGQAGRDLNQAGRDLHIEQHIDQRQYNYSADKAKQSNRREYRNRQALLTKVKNAWIKGVLQQSLHDQILVVLGLEERPDAVFSPWSMELGTTHHSPVPLPQNTQVIDLFDDIGEGRSLLILGKPGAGKTTTLLQLARDLIARAEQNADHLIPVVLNLSSWKGSRQPIADWLVEELSSKYQVRESFGQRWVKQQQLLLLLDGLDELRISDRDDCVTALNNFQQENGTEMVVCCRVEDYNVLEHRLNFQTAIYLRPLTLEQAHHYLDNLSTDLRGLRSLLENDEPLQKLAQSPLMLNIMVLTYQGVAAEDLPKTDLLEERQKQLFDDYIEKMFNRRGGNRQYSKAMSMHWLIWLAKQLAHESQTEFFIEQMQPYWLQNGTESKVYKTNGTPSICRICGFFLAMLVLIPMLAIFWIITVASVIEIVEPIGVDNLVLGIVKFILLGIMIAPLSALPAIIPFAFNSKLNLNFHEEIKPVESICWSWKEAKGGFRSGLFIGLRIGLILAVATLLCSIFAANYAGSSDYFASASISWIVGAFFSSLYFGVYLGASLGFTGGLMAESSDGDSKEKAYPNRGIWRSIRSSIVSGIIIGLGIGLTLVLTLLALLPIFLLFDKSATEIIEIGVLSLSLGLPIAAMTGIFGGLSLGGKVCIQHFILRLVFCSQGHIPWNYARFLDYAAERILLQKVGGGYIFLHRLLLEHFAAMPLRQKKQIP